jgi:hypothetical protein
MDSKRFCSDEFPGEESGKLVQVDGEVKKSPTSRELRDAGYPSFSMNYGRDMGHSTPLQRCLMNAPVCSSDIA